MDIYIVRKCTVEMKEFKSGGGARYQLPVMTKADVHSYVIKEALTPDQRGLIQKKLEEYYLTK